MARTVLTVLGVVVALLGVIYQLHFKPILTTFGWGRVIEECEIYNASKVHLCHVLKGSIEKVGNKDCKVIPELQACESNR